MSRNKLIKIDTEKTYDYKNVSTDIVQDIQKTHLNTSKTITIKTNFLDRRVFPFSTSWDFFSTFIAKLREQFNGEILLLEPEFIDSNWIEKLKHHLDFLKRFNLQIVQTNREQRIPVILDNKEIVKRQVFIPYSWNDADLRISMANCILHRHHAIKRFMAGFYNISWLITRTDKDFSYLRRNHYSSFIESDFEEFLFETKAVEKILPTYSIVDASMVGLSNEHLTTTKSKITDKIYYGKNMEKIDDEIKEDVL